MSSYTKISALKNSLLDLFESQVEAGRDYLAEFAGLAAWHVLSALEQGDDASMRELEAQTRAVAETLEEISDQAQRAALVRTVMAAARFAAVAAA